MSLPGQALSDRLVSDLVPIAGTNTQWLGVIHDYT
jgi:hypothetical protein